jgi:hypothetical protein
MIENEKIDCADALSFGLHRTSTWRKRKAALYPSDARNGRAADCLAKLAAEASYLTDDAWLQLKPHFGWAIRKLSGGHKHQRQNGRIPEANSGPAIIRGLFDRCLAVMNTATNETNCRPLGEVAVARINSAWKGNFVADACIAATQIGLLQSGNMLSCERAKNILRLNFEARQVDVIHWSTVYQAFQNGRSTVISYLDLKKRYLPTAGNDNNRFQVTWFDDVGQKVTKHEIVKGLLGVGEFSLFVAKPGTAKSVLVGDIGCHVAAGLDWHGRKVKQGLVVFFAAERKRLTERRIAAWRKKHGVTKIPFVVVGGKLDLTTGLIDAKALAATVLELEAKSGQECVPIILDTVSRTFGPADQHQSRDMGKYIQSVDTLTRATGAHVAAIHHSPWSDDRGKGAIDLDGAVDDKEQSNSL